MLITLELLSNMLSVKLKKETDMGDHVSILETPFDSLQGVKLPLSELMEVLIKMLSLSELSEYSSVIFR